MLTGNDKIIKKRYKEKNIFFLQSLVRMNRTKVTTPIFHHVGRDMNTKASKPSLVHRRYLKRG